MKVSNTKVERIVKDVSTIVTTGGGRNFTMCGEIVDGILSLKSVDAVFYEKDEFEMLNENLSLKIKMVAFEAMKTLQ